MSEALMAEREIADNKATSGDNNENQLFPVFIKLNNLRLLIAGGGNVALEKLRAVIRNAPSCSVTVVAKTVRQEVKDFAAVHENITLIERAFEDADLSNADIVIVAVNDREVSKAIAQNARGKGLLVNVADTPELCDFYLGSVVRKGQLKIAISTNGQSPTVARRLKEYFTEVIPDDVTVSITQLHQLRGRIAGDLPQRIKKLNEITAALVQVPETRSSRSGKFWRKIASWCLFAFFFMFAGHLLFSYVPLGTVYSSGVQFISGIDPQFYLMILAGFLAQLVDGALGMGYGVTCTVILLSAGVPLPAISGSIHTAEMFSSGASGFSHYKFGNVNKKLFKHLLAPGIVGAVLGAYLLAKLGVKYAGWVRPVLAVYTLFLGAKIILNAFRKNKRNAKLNHVGWLAGAGGFLDSFGGGGWGPLVTSTLISKGKTPKYVIGTVSITEFFVTLASALTFFSLIGVSHWMVIAGLIIGGLSAAPIAAKLAGKLPLKTMFIAVGILVVVWSINIIIHTFL